MQRELLSPFPLLNGEGDLTQPGFSRRPLAEYRRGAVRSAPFSIREWDDYYVGNQRFGISLTVADIGYAKADAAAVFCFSGPDAPRQTAKVVLRPCSPGQSGLPASSQQGVTASSGRTHALLFRHTDHPTLGRTRELLFHMDRFQDGQPLHGRILLSQEPRDSMVLYAPFDRPGRFLFSRKLCCLRASGAVFLGERRFTFDPADSFGVLNWGRGAFPRRGSWCWASASGLAAGVPVGFSVGHGSQNALAATENMAFFNGAGHKLSGVIFHLPAAGGAAAAAPWIFSSDDGRLSLRFFPVLERTGQCGAGPLRLVRRRAFGRFSGWVRLDSGAKLELTQLMGFAERGEYRW